VIFQARRRRLRVHAAPRDLLCSDRRNQAIHGGRAKATGSLTSGLVAAPLDPPLSFGPLQPHHFRVGGWDSRGSMAFGLCYCASATDGVLSDSNSSLLSRPVAPALLFVAMVPGPARCADTGPMSSIVAALTARRAPPADAGASPAKRLAFTGPFRMKVLEYNELPTPADAPTCWRVRSCPSRHESSAGFRRG